MGIDYVVDLECAPKEALGTQTIVDLLKARSRAEFVRDTMHSEGDVRPLSEMTFETVVLRPDGPIREQVSVQSLFDEAAGLDAHADSCAQCEARCRPCSFGCVGSVSYPIEPGTEWWLMDQLPESLDSSAGTMLTNAVGDFGWDGSHAARLREQGDTFFTKPDGIERGWDTGLHLSSDQVWHMLFGLGPLSPAHSLMCALFVGVIPHDTAPDALEQLSQDTAQVAGHALRFEVSHPEPQVAELMRFFRAMGLAAALNVDLLIDG